MVRESVYVVLVGGEPVAYFDCPHEAEYAAQAADGTHHEVFKFDSCRDYVDEQVRLATRAQALAKLTPEERAVLGLPDK